MSESALDEIKQRSLLIGDKGSIRIKSDQINISRVATGEDRWTHIWKACCITTGFLHEK